MPQTARGYAASREPAQRSPSIAARVTLRIDAAQRVVGTEFQDDGIGPVRNRPVEAGEPARGGVSGYPRIGDFRGNAFGGKGALQLHRECLVGGETVSGRQGVPQRHDPERHGRRRTRAPGRPACPASVTAATAATYLHSGANPPYERSLQPFQSSRGNHIDMDDTSAAVRPLIPAISLSGVNLSLGRGAGRVHILKDIALNIRHGEAVGLVGPSGSGKSTLLMVMAGLERPDTGEVAVDGEDIGRLDEDALARFRGRRIGIVFQSFHLIPTMTALENVAIPLELAGAADAFPRAAAELDTVGLGGRLGHYPAQLSGGEQQRVALARALVASPAILVADEPTGNLDETTGRQIIDLMFARFADRDMTLVLVTHDASLAARCDRVIRLRSGHVEEAVVMA